MSDLFNRRCDIARSVFAAWSSGNADAPQHLFTPDAVLFDVASGRFEGWPAIRAFFAGGLSRTGNLALVPDEFWENEKGLAVHYTMSGDVVLPTTFGPEHVGRRWSVEVMSYLRFDGDRVCFEADFHDKGSRAKSLDL
jgi:ketosteroid isomerase-like protein